MDILQHEIILLCPLSLYTKIADEVNRINLPCQPSSCGYCLNELLTSHFFIPGLKTSFSANPSYCSLFFILPELLHGVPGLFIRPSIPVFTF